MRTKRSVAATVATLALLAGSAATASATDVSPAASKDVSVSAVKLTPKPPKRKNGRVYARAKITGTMPKGAKTCVSLLQAHPYTPDVQVANACTKRRTGWVWTSVKLAGCGSYKSLSFYKHNDKTRQFKRSTSNVHCS
ncbi:hypothetical protein [Streptomyces sporangiiformans]|uniref:Subtilisin inhibitor domain-containing protein n=1 Tax=Streptomyces sporangiiformans TaxID=2315329 RepID=A0A505DLF0_9ACTN|nr:hypothetical protein [Streptomyces sporangiiformans]TPQ19351.1 hypothetical protein FGD71_026340 [Streptomyces sporangiiformans]